MKIISSFMVLALLAGALMLSCKKSKGPGIPDVTNFSVVDSGSFLPGGRATVTVNSTTLTDGTYTVYYFLFPNGFERPNASPVHATVVMSHHTGTFQTDPLDTPNYMVIIVDSVVKSGGGGVSMNLDGRIASFTDSTGMMTVQKNGLDTFKSPATTAKFNGGMIEVDAFSPQLGTITAKTYVNLFFYNRLGVQFFDSSFIQSMYAYFYNTTIMKVFVNQKITITALTPLVTGSFDVTCNDSTKLTGTFSCPAPR